MNRTLYFFLMIMVCISGCKSDPYRDVSHDKSYIDLLGKKYYTKQELLIHGIRTDVPKVINYYLVTDKPGVGGRGVLTQNKLPRGTIIQIKKAMYCSICLGRNLYFNIDILSEELFRDHPIRIIDIASTNNGKIIINPELFESEIKQ